MKNSKYTRIDALLKNVAKEKEVIHSQRIEKQQKDSALELNLEKIDALQKDISKRFGKGNIGMSKCLV